MFFTFQDKPLGVRKNFFLFARNINYTMDIINTVSTGSNLSGLNKEDFQKDLNN